MNEQQYSDKEIFHSILAGGNEREVVLNYLFQHTAYRKLVSEIVVKAGGNEDHSDPVFKDCIIQMDKLVRRKNYTYNSLLQFFEHAAKSTWCRILVLDSKIRDYVIRSITTDLELKNKVHSLVIKNSGSYDDAEDNYQNGLILIHDYLKEGKFQGGAVKGFFYQVCYNLWRNELKRKKAQPLPDNGFDVSITFTDPQKIMEEKERSSFLNQIFHELGDTCQKILHFKFFVVDQYSMEDIAEKMGFKNAQIASNTLSKCRKRLLDSLRHHNFELSWIRNT